MPSQPWGARRRLLIQAQATQPGCPKYRQAEYDCSPVPVNYVSLDGSTDLLHELSEKGMQGSPKVHDVEEGKSRPTGLHP